MIKENGTSKVNVFIEQNLLVFNGLCSALYSRITLQATKIQITCS